MTILVLLIAEALLTVAECLHRVGMSLSRAGIPINLIANRMLQAETKRLLKK